MKRAAAVLLCLMVACSGSSSSEDQSEEVPSRVVGLITDIEPEGGTTPTNFTVEDVDGGAYTIDIDPELDYGFDLQHVYEHFEKEDPVEVTLEERDGTLFATAIEDV